MKNKKLIWIFSIILLALPFILASSFSSLCASGSGNGGSFYTICNAISSGINAIYPGANQPTLTIVYPESKYYKTTTGIPLNYSYTIGSGVSVSTCLYNIVNSTGAYTTTNTTLSGCGNTTISVPRDDTYTVTVYLNDSIGQSTSSSQYFGVYSAGPAIVLNTPPNNTWFTSYPNNINMSFNVSDTYKISICTIYTNITGNWNAYYSFFPPITNNGTVSATTNITTQGWFIWNAWCMDQQGLNNFALVNNYFGVDNQSPVISNVAVTDVKGTQTQSFSFNASDNVALNKCWASILNSTGQEEPLYPANTSVTCNSAGNGFTVPAYGNYNLLLYANDSAGNIGSKTTSFTVSPTPSPTGGGGGGAIPITYPVLALSTPKNISALTVVPQFSDLQNAQIFAAINNYCGNKVTPTLAVVNYYQQCSLSPTELQTVITTLDNEGVALTLNQMLEYYNGYKQNLIYQAYASKDDVSKYNLVQALVQSPLIVTPAQLNSGFILPPSHTLTYSFLASKPLSGCTIINNPSITCNITQNTTVTIYYHLNDTNFFARSFTDKMAVTSGTESKNTETVYVTLLFNSVYNFSYKVLGLEIWIWFIIILSIAFSVGVFITTKKIHFKIKITRT